MDKKHTPGPWVMQKERFSEIRIETSGKDYIVLAIVKNPDSHRGYENRKLANATLIAAAPELLEALLFVDFFDESVLPIGVKEKIKSAIQKATAQVSDTITT